MASYKAEFFSQYFKRKLRPRQDYALGLIYWEARLASRMPKLANFLLQQEPLAGLGKRLVGITPDRSAPKFAEEHFRTWWERRAALGNDRPRVLLWADTFNTYFHPEVAIAATEVLEAAGYRVEIPERPLCCGRPLYDFGMLRLARRQLRQILTTLREPIQAGVPVVSLEPSCGAVFRDELLNLFPHDEDAKRLARQTRSLGEFLHDLGDDWDAPSLGRRALVHWHCHQRATSDVDCDEQVLQRLGVDAQVLDDGCCGLAGSFGYEPGEHYDISIKAGERKLLPAVREASDSTLIVTDGFSCRSQIEHGTNRSSLHLAQVVQMALRQGPNGPAIAPPERALAAVAPTPNHEE
jgi:Fe-S oxidoreductase